jgi:hypothetical protein
VAGDADKGYYSFDLGAWHVIMLNSNLNVGTGSPQETWLRADLAAHSQLCTVAIWHHPRFSSGPHGSALILQPIWKALSDAGADLVVVAHDHLYERFAPQNGDGQLDLTRGMREFVVGTGGAAAYAIVTPAPNSEVRNSGTRGVLKLMRSQLFVNPIASDLVAERLDELTGALEIRLGLVLIAQRHPEVRVLTVHVCLEAPRGIPGPAELYSLLEEHKSVFIALLRTELAHDHVDPRQGRGKMVRGSDVLGAARLVVRVQRAAQIQIELRQPQMDRQLQ